MKILLILSTICALLACEEHKMEHQMQKDLDCQIFFDNKLQSPDAVSLYRMMDYMNSLGIDLEIETSSVVDGLIFSQAQFLRLDSIGYLIGVPMYRIDQYIGFIFYTKTKNTSMISFTLMSELEDIYLNKEPTSQALNVLSLLMLQSINCTYKNKDGSLDQWLESYHNNPDKILDYCLDIELEKFQIGNIKIADSQVQGQNTNLMEVLDTSSYSILKIDKEISDVLFEIDFTTQNLLSLSAVQLVRKLHKQELHFCNNNDFRKNINDIILKLSDSMSEYNPNDLYGRVDLVIEKHHLIEALQEIGIANITENAFNGYSPLELGYESETLIIDVLILDLCN